MDPQESNKESDTSSRSNIMTGKQNYNPPHFNNSMKATIREDTTNKEKCKNKDEPNEVKQICNIEQKQRLQLASIWARAKLGGPKL